MTQAPSVTDMTHALKGMTFPADKEALKKHAQGNDAPDVVISAIEHLPGSITDVTRAYGKEDKGKISGNQGREASEQAQGRGASARRG